MTLPPENDSQSTTLATLVYRVHMLEQQVQLLNHQLTLYVPERENELQLQMIRASVDRIEKNVNETKEQVGEMKSAQDKLQIRTLLGVVTTVVTILSGILIAWMSHLIHP